MNILIKNTLRSIESNKGQVFVIILTIIIVSAMFFISLSMFDIFYNINMAEYDRIAQGSDMLLGENLGSIEFFSEARVKSFLDPADINSAFYFTKFNTILKTENDSLTVLLEATDLEYYFEKRPLNYYAIFDEKTENADIDYRLIGGYSRVIVGESFAIKNSIKVGQLVQIYVPTFNKYTEMIVEYIAKNEGIFSSPADKNILVDFSSVGNQGQVNAVYIDFLSADLYEEYYDIFEENFPAVKIGEGNSISRVYEIVRNNTTLLTVALVFLVGTMMMILFTSYLIVARNRMSEMLIFKAAGATPKQVVLILMIEVIFYGVCGGLLGLLLGRAAMGIAAFTLIPKVQASLDYSFWKYLVAFLLALFVSILATISPIMSVGKKSIRELSSKSDKITKNIKPFLFLISSVLLASIAIALIFLPKDYTLYLSPVLVLILIFWLYCAISYFLKFLGFISRKISKTGVFTLAGFSTLRNKALRTVTLMIAVITVLAFLVFEVIELVNYAVVPFKSRYDADYIVVSNYSTDLTPHSDTKELINSVEGISGTGYYSVVNFIVPGTEKKEWSIYGLDQFETLEYCSEEFKYVDKETWDQTENGIVLSNDMFVRLGVKIGDTISVNPIRTDYDDVTYNFTVIGIDYTVSEYDRIGYCKFENIDHLIESAVFISQAEEGVNLSETFIRLRSAVEGLGKKECYALSYREWALSTHENFSGVSTLLKILQFVIYFVGIIGVINISVVTAYDRRNEIKLYKVAGMSNREYVKYSFAEGLIISLAGSLMGLVMSYLVNLIMPVFASLIDKYISINFIPISLPVIFVGSLILFTGIWTIIGAVNRKRKITSINERMFE